MASNIVLSEEQVLCSICLDVFKFPVTTSCGHNFCKACIKRYWDSSDVCQCPMCKERFTIRPELRINTFIAEMVAQMKTLSPAEGTSPISEQPQAEPVEVSCDVCPGEKLKALKSCLVCLISYCETHLEPHQRAAALKKHKLIDPVENLEDRVCKKHNRLMNFFCRTDQMCVCQLCTEGNHRRHSTVPLEEEFGRRKAQLGKMKSGIQEMIQERQQKIKEVKQSAELRRRESQREIADSAQTFTALVRSIERSQAELTEVIEDNQRVAEEQAEGFIKELQQEVIELQRRSTELEKLSHTEDHFHLLHSFSSLSTPPPTKDWSQISISSELAVESVIRAVDQLEKTLREEMKKVKEFKFERIQKFAVDVTLDPDAANPHHSLSGDGKQVRWERKAQKLPNNPERFDFHTWVLGKEGFSSGKFYYEVEVTGKTGWVVGVVRGSIKRKGVIKRSPENGHWAFGLWRDVGYKAFAEPEVVLSLNQKPQKVGVFVDYVKGEVCFYDVEARSLLYSFTGCRFNDTLYPCLSTGHNRDGKNAAPLVICP